MGAGDYQGASSGASSSGGAPGLFEKGDLEEPDAVLVVGFRHEECARIRVLLDELGGRAYKVIPCAGTALDEPLVTALRAPEIDWAAPCPPADQMHQPSAGASRCVVFCGLPRADVDVVTAIMDEEGVPPFAVVVATEANGAVRAGEVAAHALSNQKKRIASRREFVAWSKDLRKQDDPLKQPFAASTPSTPSASDVSQKVAAKEDSTSNTTPDAETNTNAFAGASAESKREGAESSTSKGDPANPKEEASDDSEGDEGGWKPLDLTGLGRATQRSMEDDKAFMDPYFARGLERDETVDVVEEEELKFIEMCRQRDGAGTASGDNQGSQDAPGAGAGAGIDAGGNGSSDLLTIDDVLASDDSHSEAAPIGMAFQAGSVVNEDVLRSLLHLEGDGDGGSSEAEVLSEGDVERIADSRDVDEEEKAAMLERFRNIQKGWDSDSETL